MIHPDALSRDYARLITPLGRMGWHVSLRECRDDARFLIVIGGRPTIRIMNDGSWRSDDGMGGPDPASLLDEYHRITLEDARRRFDMGDLRGIARLILAPDEGPCAILSAARNGFGLDVEYRPRGRTLRDIRIDHWRTRMRETMRGMRRIGLEEQ